MLEKVQSLNVLKYPAMYAQLPDIKHKNIYLDYQATTPIDPRVTDAMLPFLTSRFGNPHSRTHSFGWTAEDAVERARKSVASLINADHKEIIFTSGATESANLALKGLAEFKRNEGIIPHFIALQTEHKCVLDTLRYLEANGCEVTYLPVKTNGIVDLNLLEDSIRENTVCVSIMGVNNEVGAIQPLLDIGKITRSKNVLFFCDAAQMYGKVPIDVDAMNIDLLAVSSHKIYGPKGVGALYARRKPRVRFYPLIHGGGQERGLRSGTLSPALVVGLGKAAEICSKEMARDYENVTKNGAIFLESIKNLGEFNKNADSDQKYWYPGCLNVSFSFVEGEGAMMGMKNIALSSGSACTSASLEPSYVLRALGADDEAAHSSIRYGFGRFTSPNDIIAASKNTIRTISHLREMSPLYEMKKEGVDLKSIEWSA